MWWVPVCGSCRARGFMYSVLQVSQQPHKVSVHFTEGKTESQGLALGFALAAGKCQNPHPSPGLSGLKSPATWLNFAHLHSF